MRSAEKDSGVTNLDQRRAKRDEIAPESGEPAITFYMDDDQIMFRDQMALDEYVRGAREEAWDEGRSAGVRSESIFGGLDDDEHENPYRPLPPEVGRHG